MKLQWSPSAISDRNKIYDFIDADSPRAAVLVDDRIWNAIERLKQFPETGRPGRIQGTRELVIQRTPYIAAYKIEADTIRILRVIHGAQIWPQPVPR